MLISKNMISISNCAALASASAVDTSELFARVLLIFAFLILYLVFAILFGIRLDQWDNNIRGRCYESRALSLASAKHPHVAKIYLGVTCLFMFVLLHLTLVIAISRRKVDPAIGKRRSAVESTTIMGCRAHIRGFKIFSSSAPLKRGINRLGFHSRFCCPLRILLASAKINPVLTIAMLQLPLHLYFIIRIRITNEPLLLDGSDENQWGFGQIYVLITSAAVVMQCFKGYISG